MRILLIGGMHGNEPLGLELVARLQQRPIAGVDTVVANTEAVARAARFTGRDLNRCFPGDATGDYEARRAAELLRLCRSYDVVLDFHNTTCPDNDCGFVGETADAKLFNVAAWLGLRRVIVADYDCVNKFAGNCLSVEISLSSSVNRSELWYERLEALAELKVLPRRGSPLTSYRFVYRMSLQDRDRLQLGERGLRAFRPLPPGLAEQMGVAAPAYPIFIGDTYTPYNYGGLLQKLEL